MPLSSLCSFPHLYVTEMPFPKATLFFTGTAHVSSENIAGVPLSRHFDSKHFKKKDRCRLSSETISLTDVYKEYRTIVYERCVVDTWS